MSLLILQFLKEVQEKSGTPIFPSPESFEMIENKLIEKQTFENAGIPVTPYKLVKDSIDLKDFGTAHGWPFLLKSSKGGYDGYGNKTVSNFTDAIKAFEKLGGFHEAMIYLQKLLLILPMNLLFK